MTQQKHPELETLIDRWTDTADYRSRSFQDIMLQLEKDDVALFDAIMAFSVSIDDLQNDYNSMTTGDRLIPSYLMWFFHQIILDVHQSSSSNSLASATRELLSITDKLISKDESGILTQRYTKLLQQFKDLGLFT